MKKALAEQQADCLARVREFRADIFRDRLTRDRGASAEWSQLTLSDVRRVVVINAGPRTGSSLLFSILHQFPCFYALSGEGVPFYRLNGFTSDLSSSDEIPPELAAQQEPLAGLARDLFSDCARGNQPGDIWGEETLSAQFVDDLILRLPLQWPLINFNCAILKKIVAGVLATYQRQHPIFLKEEFYAELLPALCREYPDINPYYYDLPADLIRARFPAQAAPQGPPNNILMIEEPPFILLSPRQKITARDLQEKTLLLKTSVDSYRMPFLAAIFPRADIKIIYLVRNPAASMNGLYDGWLHHGFFSHNLEALSSKVVPPLSIAGYSDRYEWGKRWWKYDLPPGWENFAERCLEEVCAFQWFAANQAVKKYLKQSQKPFCLLKHEDIVKSLATREAAIARVLDFLGMDRRVVPDLSLKRLSVVQATETPANYRWRNREKLLWPILNYPDIAEMCAELGYDKNRNEEWL